MRNYLFFAVLLFTGCYEILDISIANQSSIVVSAFIDNQSDSNTVKLTRLAENGFQQPVLSAAVRLRYDASGYIDLQPDGNGIYYTNKDLSTFDSLQLEVHTDSDILRSNWEVATNSVDIDNSRFESREVE